MDALILGVVVVVIKPGKNRALAALTTAALSLPGLDVGAAVPVANTQGNVEYGNYQESGNRMNVQIYHVDGLMPLTDRIELSFSYDRDTYSGASPAYSLPATMTNQSYDTTGLSSSYYQNQVDAHLPTSADVISSASTVSTQTLMGTYPSSTSGLPNFQSYWNGLEALYQTNPGHYDALYFDPVAGTFDTNKMVQSKEFVMAGINNALNSVVPTGTQTIQRFQTQPLETRTQPTFGAKYYFDNSTLGLSGGQSDEPDYVSTFGAINFSHEFNEKKTTVSAGYNVANNAIYRNGGMSMAPPGVGLGMIMPADCTGGNCLPASHLDTSSMFNGMNLGLTQVLAKNTLFNASAGYTNQSGFLSNPYKAVYIRGEVTPEKYYQLYESTQGGPKVDWSSITQLDMLGLDLFRENRPKERNQFNLSSGVNQYIPALDASLHFDYRFYHDDWKVNSHTFEFKWFQPLPFGITATPNVRYYSQSQADFFAPYFLAPRADNHYSSDYRLSAFGSLNGGLTLSKKLGKGITLEAGYDYYMHASDLKLGGGGSGSYADFNYYMAHAGINVDLSAPASLFGGGGDSGGHEHHHHMHHGSLPPAGVMFGHMMHQSNDVMIGYMYMNSQQGGNMIHGSQTVSDAVLAQGASIPIVPGSIPAGGFPTTQQIAGLNDACPGYGAAGINKFTDFGCLVKPTSMVMGMHMFDIMYAPTDWLNLMVMPQLVDMKMSMSGDLRTPMGQNQSMDWMNSSTVNEVMNPADANSMYAGMNHNVFDLGDTIVMTLIKLFDNPNHHLHVGIGGSAPTGSVSELHYQIASVPVPGGVNPNTGLPGSSMMGPFYPVNIKVLQDIGMQAGSGTWDFKPSLTYNGQMKDAFWGAQYSSVNRFQDHNKSGYALGDTYQATTWAGYSMFNWVSATVRGVYTQQNKVRGDLYQIQASQILDGTNTDQIGHDTVSPVNYPQNTGGHYWDVGLGVRMMAPNGAFAGHTVSFEWLQPVKDVVNGYQLERTGSFAVNWSYMF